MHVPPYFRKDASFVNSSVPSLANMKAYSGFLLSIAASLVRNLS